jgi:hypothetical protein
MDHPSAEPEAWGFPAWIDAHLAADAQFAKAYESMPDASRALIKSAIARHYALRLPAGRIGCSHTDCFSLFTRRVDEEPAPYVLIVLDEATDAPALALAALMPAICARVPQVLVCRCGQKNALPDGLLVACELAGQERLAALAPAGVERLVAECAAAETPGVILHSDTPSQRRIFARPSLREALDASTVRVFALRPPRRCAVWRDAPEQFPEADLALMYGGLNFRQAGATADGPDFPSLSAAPLELMLLPRSRMAGGVRAAVSLDESCLGHWRWRDLCPDLFLRRTETLAATP